MPTIYFQVNSLDYWERHRVEGYGMLKIPTDPGSYQTYIQTFRPVGSFVHELRRFFVGGGPMLTDRKAIDVSAHKNVTSVFC